VRRTPHTHTPLAAGFWASSLTLAGLRAATVEQTGTASKSESYGGMPDESSMDAAICGLSPPKQARHVVNENPPSRAARRSC